MIIASVGDKMARYYANKIQYVNTGEPIILLNDNDSNIDNSQCKHRDSNEKMHFYPNCETGMREDNKKEMKSLKQVQREEKKLELFILRKNLLRALAVVVLIVLTELDFFMMEKKRQISVCGIIF